MGWGAWRGGAGWAFHSLAHGGGGASGRPGWSPRSPRQACQNTGRQGNYRHYRVFITLAAARDTRPVSSAFAPLRGLISIPAQKQNYLTSSFQDVINFNLGPKDSTRGRPSRPAAHGKWRGRGKGGAARPRWGRAEGARGAARREGGAGASGLEVSRLGHCRGRPLGRKQDCGHNQGPLIPQGPPEVKSGARQ